MFRPFKLIFKLIGLLMLIITLLPIIFLVIMYKDYKPPINDFETHETLSFNSILENKIDEFLADDTAMGFEITLEDGETNKVLKDFYASNNPNFGKTDESIPKKERLYAQSFGDNGGFKGVTVKFSEDYIQVEAGIEAGFSNIYYKTTVLIKFKLETLPVVIDDEHLTQYKLTIKDIKLGNLPILWMYDLTDWGFGLIAGNSLDNTIKDIVSGFGNYDLKTKSVWVTTNDLLNLIEGDSDSKAMLEALFGFIDEEELLEFKTEDNKAGIEFKLGKARSTKDPYLLNHHITSESELNQMFQGQLTSLLLSSLDDNSETIKYNMHEQSFNQMLEYYVGNQMDITETFEIAGAQYELKTKPLFGEFDDDKVNLTIIMTLNKVGETDLFKTHFTLVTTPGVLNDSDLVFNIVEIELGDNLTISNDKLKAILNLIGDNDFIEDDKIIIKDFLTEFKSTGVSVEDIKVKGKYLRFYLKPDNMDLLAELQGAISDALEDVLSDPEYSDVDDAYNNYLLDPNDDNLDEIMDAINNLSPEKQEELFNAILDGLDDIDDLGDLIP
ncbi:MAG: hypothetical protein WC907_00050 [Acholeplasmataceae bacterium]